MLLLAIDAIKRGRAYTHPTLYYTPDTLLVRVLNWSTVLWPCPETNNPRMAYSLPPTLYWLYCTHPVCDDKTFFFCPLCPQMLPYSDYISDLHKCPVVVSVRGGHWVCPVWNAARFRAWGSVKTGSFHRNWISSNLLRLAMQLHLLGQNQWHWFLMTRICV